MHFEGEIQELIFTTLIGDAILQGFLGGEESDKRIYLAFQQQEAAKVSDVRPAHIVIETMPAPAPLRLGSGIDSWTERYCLHVFTRPEDRYTRMAVEDWFRAFFHRKTFETKSYLVFQSSEDGREGGITDGGLFDQKYFISFQFMSKT